MRKISSKAFYKFEIFEKTTYNNNSLSYVQWFLINKSVKETGTLRRLGLLGPKLSANFDCSKASKPNKEI